MKRPQLKLYLIFCTTVILLSVPAILLHAEGVSKTPEFSKPKQLSKPISSDKPLKTPKVKKQTPKIKLKSGYCLTESEIEALDKKGCTRKRGKFFTSERSARSAFDSQKGFCCNNGMVERSQRKSCTRGKGSFFINQKEATHKCAATKGFCCNEGVVGATSKGDCDREKGNFYIKKHEATRQCAKQSGYCCKDGEVTGATQGDCQKKQGSFSIRKNEVERVCDKQNGYCCDNGKVSRMNKVKCDQVKGSFSIKQAEAHQICRNENGFCCQDGKIVKSTRGRCTTAKGLFAEKRLDLQKECRMKKLATKKPNARPVAKAEPKKIAKVGPTVQPEIMSVPEKPKLKQNNGSSKQLSEEKKMVPADKKIIGRKKVEAAHARPQLINKQKIPKPQGQGYLAPAIEVEGDPESDFYTLIGPGAQVVYVKDRIVQIGHLVDKNGLGNKLEIPSVRVSFPCNSGKPLDAAIKIEGGASHDNLAPHLQPDGHYISYSRFELQNQQTFVRTYCQPGKLLKDQEVDFDISMMKTCRNNQGQDVELTTKKTLPLVITCDMRPMANPYRIDNEFEFGKEQLASGNMQLAEKEIETQPQIIQTSETMLNLSISHDQLYFIDNDLRLGSQEKPAHAAPTISSLKSNISVEAVCGFGSLKKLDLLTFEGRVYRDLQTELGQDGKGTLKNKELISKDRAAERYCKAGSYSPISSMHSLRVILQATCTGGANGERMIEKDFDLPLKVTCDRREYDEATRERESFLHSCPEGFHILKDPEKRQSVYSSQDYDNPLKCIKDTSLTIF